MLAVMLLGAACSRSGQPEPRVLKVPGDFPTVQAAVDASRPGDLVLLGPGRYPGAVTVPADHPSVTIRGSDRNAVVFDGADRRAGAIEVRAAGVTLENFTARHFRSNAIEWESVHGFAGRFLTVFDVGGYGIYAVRSTGGLLERDLVSGAGNSGFYIGECDPCGTVLKHDVARLSAIGYSGTNAGTDLFVTDSVFDRNGTGILPNSYDEEAHPPQSWAVFDGNQVRASGTVPTPSTDPLGGFTGIGIGVAGGQDDRIANNFVTGSARYGIVLFPTIQAHGPPWRPARDTVRRNEVRGSGVADLAVSGGAGPRNCFAGNRFSSSLPRSIEGRFRCGAGPGVRPTGDPSVAAELAVPSSVAYARAGARPSYTTMPPPGPQRDMPGRAVAPSGAGPESDGSAAGALALAAFVRSRPPTRRS